MSLVRASFAGLYMFPMFLLPCGAVLSWKNSTVLTATESHIVQLRMDVLHVAKVLTDLTIDEYLQQHIHPLLAVHSGWDRVKHEVAEAADDLRSTLEPGRRTTVSKARRKRSFLGIATATDIGALEAKLTLLQTSEEHSRRLETFLTSRTRKLTDFLKDLSARRTASLQEQAKEMFKIKAECTAVLLAQAGRAVRDELRTITRSLLTGKVDAELFSPLHVGSILGVSTSEETFLVTMDVTKLRPERRNCTCAEDMTPVCVTETGGFARAKRETLDLPTISGHTKIFSSLNDAIDNNDLSFEQCLQLPISPKLHWQYFCWGSKGRQGFRSPPKVIPIARHSADPVRVNLDVAELTVPTTKNELNDVELLSFDDLYPVDALYPAPLSPPAPKWLIIVFCISVMFHWILIGALGYLCVKMWVNLREIKNKLIWVQSSLGLDEPPP